MATTRAPAGLAGRGRRFWRSVVDRYELSESELLLLVEACRALDDLDRLLAVIREHGAMVTGSQGQPVVNPAIAEARAQRVVLHRLLAALQLPDDEGVALAARAPASTRRPSQPGWRGRRKAAGGWRG